MLHLLIKIKHQCSHPCRMQLIDYIEFNLRSLKLQTLLNNALKLKPGRLPGQRQLDRHRLRAGYRLHQTQHGFGGGHIGEALLAVISGHFQLVTICYQLTAFFVQTAFQHPPVFSGSLKFSGLHQHLHGINHRQTQVSMASSYTRLECELLLRAHNLPKQKLASVVLYS
jgi:hypothetical protein